MYAASWNHGLLYVHRMPCFVKLHIHVCFRQENNIPCGSRRNLLTTEGQLKCIGSTGIFIAGSVAVILLLVKLSWKLAL